MKRPGRVHALFFVMATAGAFVLQVEGRQAIDDRALIVRVRQIVRDHRRRIRLRFMTQIKRRPPTFVLSVSQPEELGDDYLRYLTNRLRDDFGMPGVPIRVQWMRHDEHLWEPYGSGMVMRSKASLDAAGSIVGCFCDSTSRCKLRVAIINRSLTATEIILGVD